MKKKKFISGATRSGSITGSKKYPPRYALISTEGLRRLAETYGEGAIKYGDRNWEKGLPASDSLDRSLAHINAYLAGDRSEDHLAHAAWGLFAVMHFEKHDFSLIDIPSRIK